MEKREKRQKQKETFKKVLRYIKKYWFYLILSILLAVITVVLTLYIPILIGDAVDEIVGAGHVDFAAIFVILKRMAVVILATAAAQWVMNLCNNKMTYGVVQDIRNEAFQKIESLPISYLDAHSHGDMVSRIIADVDQFADGLLMGFTQFFTGVMTIVGTLLFMLSVNAGITLVVVGITPLSFVVAGFIAKRTFSMFQLQSETRGEQTSLVDEMVGNQKIVQAFGHEKEALERFDEINGRLEKASLRAIFYSSTTNPSTRFINSLVYAGVGVTGALFAIQGRLSVGQLTCFLNYANQYTKPFNEISGVVTELQNALACAARIFELIEEEPEKPDAKDAVVLNEVDGSVAMQHVYFSYLPEQKLIEDFNLKVLPGQRVAIVGPTGCGKTTMINLLMRFYELDSGEIRIDGVPTSKLTRENVHDLFCMVLQDTWLFEGTIKENVIYCKEGITDEQVEEACKAVGIHHFIQTLPEGYNTILNDHANLSAGQKQLLTIARAMIENAPMLILDEATSSVDTRTEIQIQQAMDKLTQGRTSFIIAHRLSTIKNADLILVMKDGDIIESGTHENLLSQGGFYADLYNSQFEQVS